MRLRKVWPVLAALFPLIPAALSPAYAEPVVMADPQNWQGLDEADYRASIRAHIESIDSALNEGGRPAQALQRAVTPAVQLIATLRASPYPAIGCDELVPLVETLDAGWVLERWSPALSPLNPPLSNNAEEQAMREYLAASFVQLRTGACVAAHGASSPSAEAALRAQKLFNQATGRSSDAASVFDTVYAQSDAPRANWIAGALQQLARRAGIAQQLGDRAAYLRDSGELRRQAAASDLDASVRLGSLGTAGYLALIAGETEATRKAIAQLEQIEPVPDRSCLLGMGLAGLAGQDFGQWRSAAPEACRTNTREEEYYREVRTVASALLTEIFLPDLDAARAAQAFPAWRSANNHDRAVRSVRRPMAAANAPYSDSLGGGGAASELEAAWFARRNGDPLASVDAAFAAAQDLASSGYGHSLTLRAAEIAARNKGLGDLVAEYEALAARLANLPPPTLGGAPQGNTANDAASFARLRELSDVIKARFPEYLALSTPQTVSIGEVQRALGEDEALLMLVNTSHAVHILAIDRQGASWERSPLSLAETNRSIGRLVHDLRMSYPLPETVRRRWNAQDGRIATFHSDLAYGLYRAWIAPVAARLDGKKRIVTVSAGIAATLPLGVLVTEEPSAGVHDFEGFRAAAWMADRWVLSTAASADSLVRSRSEGAGATGAVTGFVGIGDPDFGGSSEQRGLPDRPGPLTILGDGTHGGVAEAMRGLFSLPGTAPELEGLAAMMAPDATIITGLAATESAVRTRDWSGVSVVSFATHGLMAVNTPAGLVSGLAFTPPDAPDDGDDGLLGANEVALLDMPIDLVILSACDTATALAFDNGGSMTGLVRAFGYAGVRRIVASYWPVDDVAASTITRRLVELRNSAPGDEAAALQQASREFRMEPDGDYYRDDGFYDSQAHPAIWGAFAVFGE
ncbi:MAG: CHAT domain-containing protein [Blastomonas sp.]